MTHSEPESCPRHICAMCSRAMRMIGYMVCKRPGGAHSMPVFICLHCDRVNPRGNE